MESLLELLESHPIAVSCIVLPFASAVYAMMFFTKEQRNSKVADGATAAALHTLRDRGARLFVAQLLAKLKEQAAYGRSDYEFHFRGWDRYLEMRPVFNGIFACPMFVSYWNCIDSAGSREVIKAMLEEGDTKGLRVDWSVSTNYGKSVFAPKWVLSCQWDKVELRKNQIGGR